MTFRDVISTSGSDYFGTYLFTENTEIIRFRSPLPRKGDASIGPATVVVPGGCKTVGFPVPRLQNSHLGGGT